MHLRRRALAALALCFAVAVHAGPRVTTFASPTQPPPAVRTLPVLDLGTAPPQPVRVLAVISIESAGPMSLSSQPDHAFWARLFQAPAREAGAQAVVGVHAVQHVSDAIWVASGLAVEYGDAGAPPDSCGCVVLVPEPVVRTEKKEKNRARLAASLQARLLALCAEHGWYPLAGADSARAAPGVGVDARLALVLDSLPPEPAGDLDRSRRVTSDPARGMSMGARCVAALVTAAGDTLRGGARDARPNDVASMLGTRPELPMTAPGMPGSTGFSLGANGLQMFGHRTSAFDEVYWRAVNKSLEPLPAPVRAR